MIKNQQDTENGSSTVMEKSEIKESYDIESSSNKLNTYMEYISEVKKRLEWKAILRELNINPQNRPEESDFHLLDSSLKKNTGFIRKLKNYTDAQKDCIISDLKTLNLTKYIGEVASAIVESKIKMTDLPALLEISSLLHQRYLDFSSCFLEAWSKALTIKKEIANPSKLRVDLRFYAELISVGVFRLKEGLPLLGTVLTALINSDKETHQYISIILAFCKYCGDDYAGLLPRKIRILSEEHPSITLPKSSLLSSEKQKNVRSMLREYYNSLCKHLLRNHTSYQNLERGNRRILYTKGEIHSEKLEMAEQASLALSKLCGNAEQLSDFLDEDPPILEKEEKKDFLDDPLEDNLEIESSSESSLSQLSGALWEDEDTRIFYEELSDLKAFIPAILYVDSLGENNIVKYEEEIVEIGEDEEAYDESAEVEKENENGNQNEEDDDDDEEEVIVGDEDEDECLRMEEETEDDTPSNSSNKALLDAFLAHLPTCVSRDMTDHAAADFCMRLNTKKNRLKLVKCLFSVHRNRQDLLPFYSRLVATLHPCMPDISVSLGQYLKQEFRWQLRKKDQMKIESKLKVVRFIGELVKFQMFSKSEALFCMKQLLFNFSHHHIEMACTLMETCGRFLLRSPDSHQRTKIYLEQMMRKKQAMLSSDSRYNMMIENAFYNVSPPEGTSAIQRPIIPPWQIYISNLITGDLSKKNTEKILKKIRKLDWKSSEVTDFILQLLTSVWHVKYYNIRFVASLIAGLVPIHEWLVVRLIDNVLEDIRLGMEVNEPKFNQRRLSVIKFLGELYNYCLVDSSIIFDVLYSLITFGNDEPEQMIRIKLVCALLDTCGGFFIVGTSKLKLEYFLVYFQRYVLMKKANFSSELDFPFAINNLVNETLRYLRPKIQLIKTLEKAEEKVKKIEKEIWSSIQEKYPNVLDSLDSFTESYRLRTINEDEDEESENLKEEEHETEYSYNPEENSQEDDPSLEEDEYCLNQNLAPKIVKCTQDDDEFINMFDKMMNENLTESRGSSRPPLLDIHVPMNYKQKQSKQQQQQTQQQIDSKATTINFAVLMRKQQGKQQGYRELAVPTDSDIAKNLLRQEEAARLEKESVKRLTLEISGRQEEEDLNEALAILQRPSLVSLGRESHRRNKFIPPKGAPDVELIFGSKKTLPNNDK